MLGNFMYQLIEMDLKPLNTCRIVSEYGPMLILRLRANK